MRRIDIVSRSRLPSDKLGGSMERTMAHATGEVIETPTQVMPFKTVIYLDGSFLQEEYFNSRLEAEIYMVDILKGLADLAKKEGHLD
jgi:hypothetical protein